MLRLPADSCTRVCLGDPRRGGASPGAGLSVSGGTVTFARDVAPILFDRCGVCHHPGGTAPFSLLTYPAARQRARLIAAVTSSRVMPPWKSEPGYGEFIGHRPLGDAEIGVIQQWLADGAPEGDRARSPAGAAMDRRMAARHTGPRRVAAPAVRAAA